MLMHNSWGLSSWPQGRLSSLSQPREKTLRLTGGGHEFIGHVLHVLAAALTTKMNPLLWSERNDDMGDGGGGVQEDAGG